MKDMRKQKPLGKRKTTHLKEAGVGKDASFKTVSKESFANSIKCLIEVT